MNTIFQTLVYQRKKGQDTVLATIIWDDGSAPRGAGSQIWWAATVCWPVLSAAARGGAVHCHRPGDAG